MIGDQKDVLTQNQMIIVQVKMVAQCDSSVANLAVAKTGGRSTEDAIAYIFEKSVENQKMEHPFIGY